MNNSSSTLDCKDGLACDDYECELRHLDAVEQENRRRRGDDDVQTHDDTFQKRNPNLIVTASRDMGRSASTWVFNAIRMLYRQAKEPCDSYWIRSLSAEKLRTRLQQATANDGRASASVLIKTHEQSQLTQDAFSQHLSPLLTHVIVSVREGFPPDPAWIKHATYVVRYEDLVANTRVLEVLRGLAKHLGIATLLTEGDLRQVDYQLMTLPIPGDQSSKFWSFHARRGGRATPSAPPTAKQPAQTRNVFVTRHGARIDSEDSNWLQKAGHGRRQDTHLSALGYQEAKELANELLRRCQDDDSIQLDHIVSSPFVRCIETADAVAKLLDLDIKVEPGIAEVGSSASQMASLKDLCAQFPRIDPNYCPVMSRKELSSLSEYGDTSAARRASKVAQTVVQNSRLGGDDGSSILFVGHGASCLGLVSAFGAPQQYIGYCSLTHFQKLNEEGKDWRLVKGIGDVSHLSDPQTSLDSAW